MAHRSDDSKRLKKRKHQIRSLKDLPAYAKSPVTFLLIFPPHRSDADGANAKNAFKQIASFSSKSNEESTICILTSAPDAARLLPFLEKGLHYKLWIAVKTKIHKGTIGQLPETHVALLVLTRYKTSLRHTVTRVGYTYCPACGKTTKDYGGKKHIYNPYGTLLSDVWRDIECEPEVDTSLIEDRLQDAFGVAPYRSLEVLDLRKCSALQSKKRTKTRKAIAPPVRRKAKFESKLINGDCLSVLSSIPESSIDFCFADPPYNIQKKYDHWNDALEAQAYFAWCDRWLSQLTRVLKPGGTLAVINIPLWAVRHYQYLITELDFQAWITWEGLGLPVRMIMPSNYAIICFSKGAPRPLPGLRPEFLSTKEGKRSLPVAEFYCGRQSCVLTRNYRELSDRAEFTNLWYDIHRIKHNSRRVDHPCQLPPALMRRLYTIFTSPGEIVLDCFNGAGTSTLVAEQMNRKFIGIEVSAQYHKIAQRRHEALAWGGDPFAKRNEIPQAKNSRVNRLPKQRYAVSKKALQLEIRAIANKLGRLPTRDDVKALSQYPLQYFDTYFVSWGEVCAAARHQGMSELPSSARVKEEAEAAELTLF